MKNYEVMQNFTLKNIPDLDVCVRGALELFSSLKLPKMNIYYKRPLVVGSGNAEVTGRILFSNKDAVFANESNFEEKLKTIKNIDGVVIVSASGGKHAPIIAKVSRKYKKKVTLLTNNEKALAKKYSSKTIVFPKQREPYTYNTSTYLSMILGKTGEDPEQILKFLDEMDKIKFPKFKKFKGYYIILPKEFLEVKRMFQIKFIELFGRKISRDIESEEYIKHSTTIVPSKELFIGLGVENKSFGKDRLNIILPKNVNYGMMIACGYYLIGKIQKSYPPYFKKNLEKYLKETSNIFSGKIGAIVD